MRRITFALAALTLVSTGLLRAADQSIPDAVAGEKLDPALYGEAVVESFDAAVARDLARATGAVVNPKARNGAHGAWLVPSRNATFHPHSGTHNLVNKWGDTRMGIGFPHPVTVDGAFVAAQGGRGAWTSGLRVVGYRSGEVVQTTDWFRAIGETPVWFAMRLTNVDRIVLEAESVQPDGAGWYALDDLTYTPVADAPGETSQVVIDFEDCSYGQSLTDSTYAGLTWETGAGEFREVQIIHPPQAPPRPAPTEVVDTAEPGGLRAATAPQLVAAFQGVVYGGAPGATSIPPDTCGAVGPNHFGVAINTNLSFYSKSAPYTRAWSTSLGSFLPGSSGDPRILFDQHSNRWIVMVTDFSTRIYLAVSLTTDPLGSWFKTSFVVSSGADSGRWPDFPTLGVDANGIYCSAYMVGGSGMSIFAIDKAPIVGNPPALGTVTAFRDLPFEGAIQPVHTYGAPAGEYFISVRWSVSNKIRVRRVNPPLTSPTLSTLGDVTITSHSSPPTAPALGSTVEVDTGDTRIWHTPVYRNGYVWAAHTIDSGGRAAARWYKVDVAGPSPLTLADSGTVNDAGLYFYYPHVMVNSRGDAALGFSGSNASQYVGAYYVGRRADDPAGQMSTPVQYRAGVAAYTMVDGYGRNRWGDYSATTLEPNDQLTFWMLQEYVNGANAWGTQVAKLSYGDCNNNGVSDPVDIAQGTSLDCNADEVPDECQLVWNDCDSNAVPDDCDSAALIVAQPQNATVCPGTNVQFSVAASPVGATFQWLKEGNPLTDGGDISGAATPELSLAHVDAADAGNYACRVTDGCIVAASQAATLTVLATVAITGHPSNRTACAGADASFSVTATGAAPLTYEWRRNGSAFGAPNLPTLVLVGVDYPNEAGYSCYVSNQCGGVLSDAGVLNVVGPTFTEHPQNACGEIGATVVLTADAAADSTIYWAWKKNGSITPSDGTNTLVLLNVQTGDAGQYRAVAATYVGATCIRESNAATVTVGNCPCLTFGDLDADGDLDLVDMARFTDCFGAGGAAAPGCACANVDQDPGKNVDLADWTMLQQLITGPQG